MINELTFGVPRSLSRVSAGFLKDQILSDQRYFPSQLDYTKFQPEVLTNYIDNLNSTQTEVVSASFGAFSGSSKWNHGILAPNGKIYCIPNTAADILIIDTATDTALRTGALGGVGNKYRSGVLAPNGCIYGIPYTASVMLKIDPNTDSISTIGAFGSGTLKWWGSVLAPNGKIYCAPFVDERILVVDPSNDSWYFINQPIKGAGGKWHGGCLGTNGKIYFSTQIPANGILVIDPEDDSFYRMQIPSTFNSIALVLAQNGKIYSMPIGSTIHEIDTENDIVKLVASFASGTYTVYSGALAPTGKIYAGQVNKAGIFRFDPETYAHDSTIVDAGTSNKGTGNTLGPNGAVYHIPFNRTSVVKILTNYPININYPLSPQINHF